MKVSRRVVVIGLMFVVLVGCTDREAEQRAAKVEAQLAELKTQAQQIGDLANLNSHAVAMGDSLDRYTDELVADIRASRRALNQAVARAEQSANSASDELQAEIKQLIVEIDQNLDELRWYTIEQREEFEIAATDQLEEAARELAEFESRIEQLNDSARDEYRITANEVRSEQQELEEKLSELKSATEEEFRQMRRDFVAGLVELERDVRRMAKEVELTTDDSA